MSQQLNQNDPNTKLYSDAFDKGVAGGPKPDPTWLDAEAKAAVEFGYDRGVRLQKEVSHANRNDPSGDFLTRSTLTSMKWRL